jgi:hypothetical protein
VPLYVGYWLVTDIVALSVPLYVGYLLATETVALSVPLYVGYLLATETVALSVPLYVGYLLAANNRTKCDFHWAAALTDFIIVWSLMSVTFYLYRNNSKVFEASGAALL